ncbi:MAG TPA: hypothetical protein VHO90_20675 [Bacteroidales bacterium]|nr:hypothetical protein [Bacteroidales bacterium]
MRLKRIYLVIATMFFALKIYSQAYIMPVDTIVCYGASDFNLRLLNNTKTILRWEMSATGTEPWVTIKNQTPYLRLTDMSCQT